MAPIETEEDVRAEPDDDAEPQPADDEQEQPPRCSCEGGLVRL